MSKNFIRLIGDFYEIFMLVDFYIEILCSDFYVEILGGFYVG